ncbi:MAG: hypothetical protein V2I36_12950 [Desulfopila sp.]|nr:hypothetical protein [Desulfopila sp.]
MKKHHAEMRLCLPDDYIEETNFADLSSSGTTCAPCLSLGHRFFLYG